MAQINLCFYLKSKVIHHRFLICTIFIVSGGSCTKSRKMKVSVVHLLWW